MTIKQKVDLLKKMSNAAYNNAIHDRETGNELSYMLNIREALAYITAAEIIERGDYAGQWYEVMFAHMEEEDAT